VQHGKPKFGDMQPSTATEDVPQGPSFRVPLVKLHPIPAYSSTEECLMAERKAFAAQSSTSPSTKSATPSRLAEVGTNLGEEVHG